MLVAIVSKQMANEKLKQLGLAFIRQMFQLVDFSCHVICWKMTSSDTKFFAQLNCNYKTVKYNFIATKTFHGTFERIRVKLIEIK